MTWRLSAKCLAFARISAALTRAERGELLGRALFFPLILGVFSALWRAVAEAGMPIAMRPSTLVWYVAATEWVLLSTPQIQFQIERDVRNGDIAYRLPRPVSYLTAALAEGFGSLAMRAPIMAVAALLSAVAFAGLPEHPRGLLFLAPLGFCASAILMVFNVCMGILAFWFQAIAPIHWVWQKLSFVLGGLMLPLELFPEAIQWCARATPFPTVLYGPARFMMGSGVEHAAGLTLALALWLCVALGLAVLLYGRVLRSIAINGG